MFRKMLTKALPRRRFIGAVLFCVENPDRRRMGFQKETETASPGPREQHAELRVYVAVL